MSIWIIGAGAMAAEYSKVLGEIGSEFKVIGRGEASSLLFEKNTGNKVIRGGLKHALKKHCAPIYAIVAVNVNELSELIIELIQAGTKNILVEKPGGLNIDEIEKVEIISNSYSAKVWVAYNRRFYASVEHARSLIELDGGATSLSFEFTEWSHKLKNLVKPTGVKENWLLGNSSHVIDLAFHLCGPPIEWKGWYSGSLDWHSRSARFSGAGITNKNVLFSYIADWEAPGRWGVEIMTRKRRLILRPMEQLQQILIGSLSIDPVEIDYHLDNKYKPGLFKQVDAFISGNLSWLCPISEQLNNSKIYSQIGGYK
jgi:predicted dehydrogenase